MTHVADPWLLVHSGGPIDAERLFTAFTSESMLRSTDTRTRLLVRDALQGVREFWGEGPFNQHLLAVANRSLVDAAINALPREEGFFTIRERLMNATNPDVLAQLFRDLGTQLAENVSVTIGDSMALMLDAFITRHTDDIDVVNEIPAPIRNQHALPAGLASCYGLKLTHFRSHYLTDGWESRTQAIGQFGRLSVRAVDPIDILTGKLFSRRSKDLDDVRLAWNKVNQQVFRKRITDTTEPFRRDVALLAVAVRNWYVITGETILP